MRSRLQFDDGSKYFFIIFLIVQLFFTNGILLCVGMLIFYLLFENLQQPYKPSVFTIILFYHFLQISAGVWQSNYLGVDINFRSPNTANAVISAYIGLIFLFSPIIYYQNKIPKLDLKKFKEHAAKLSTDKVFRVYVISFFGITILQVAAGLAPSLFQLINGFTSVKWMLFLLFGFMSILKKEKRKMFYLFCAFEFLTGFYSYFSDFKTVVFYLLFLMLVLLPKIRVNKLLIGVAGIVVLTYLAIFWTSIKGEYRGFLNQGSSTQSVQVDQSQALNKLVELSRKEDNNSFQDATAGFLDRLQYTYHLARTMDVVPSQVPFQNGANWGKTLEFVLTPRILNPDKGVYDASQKATKYTGIYYSGYQKGVSVSLGYFADGYIDFGYVGMFIPLLILGFIYGWSYFYFVKNSSSNYLFNFSAAGTIFMGMFAFESDNIFVIGQIYLNLVVFFILKAFLFPRLMTYISLKPKTTEL